MLAGVLVGLGLVLPSRGRGASGRRVPRDGGPGEARAARGAGARDPGADHAHRGQPQAVLDPPRNPRDVGWWKRSVRPGATRGQTVLTGHTVHTGGGVDGPTSASCARDRWSRSSPRKGTMVYRATRVVTWSKAELAERAVDIFAQERGGTRLVLITCTDWNGSAFESNVVVFAKPLGRPRPLLTRRPASGHARRPGVAAYRQRLQSR